jgi:multisubunit Na+/H+ antiporter MnhB subunit
MNVAACMALFLISLSIEPAEPSHSENLSPVSYVILSVVLLLVIFGLGWCFYRAVTSTSREDKIQHPDEVGNGDQ